MLIFLKSFVRRSLCKETVWREFNPIFMAYDIYEGFFRAPVTNNNLLFDTICKVIMKHSAAFNGSECYIIYVQVDKITVSFVFSGA